MASYLRRFFPPPVEGNCYEANLEALAWIERIGRALRSGWALSIDNRYTQAEAARFPRGTLMGYRRHTATDDMLLAPGERDITAHVNFSALAARGEECGMRTDRLETMAQSLMTAGKEEFARPLAAPDAAEERRRRLQMKTLLFGVGETFQTLWQRKDGEKSEGNARNNEKGPGNRGLGVETLPFLRACPKLLLFLRSSFLLRGSLLGCALHRLILPNIEFCDLEKPQCDSYIKLFARKVKKKMHIQPLSTLVRLRSRPSLQKN